MSNSGYQLSTGCKACKPHIRGRGKEADTHGFHGLACRKSCPRQQRHSHLNDIIWCAIKRAQIPSVKEPCSGLLRQDGKRPAAPRSCRGREESHWHGTSSPRHVCRRPRQQHSHGNRSCSQPRRHQQDQQILPTIGNSHLHSSGH